MRCRIISAVALYGPKADPLREFLAGVQALVTRHVGETFRPYPLDQIHATLIWLNAAPDPRTGEIVNERHLQQTGVGRPMDLDRATRILADHLAQSVRIRIGGFGPEDKIPFRSRGLPLHDRAFSAQQDAFVLVGWPTAALAGSDRPLDRLRRAMNAAGVYHRYHDSDTDVDDDCHLVVGLHAGAPAGAVEDAVAAVREKLAAEPFEFEIGADDVKIVASDSRTLAPALFVGDLGVGAAALAAFMS